MKITKKITKKIAEKVLETVDAGLVEGLGTPEPGKMCVEAAVCYAMGLPHGDKPKCVAPALRALKIRLNDCFWSSSASRARGLRRLALAQLGSAGVLDEMEFTRRVMRLIVQTVFPPKLRSCRQEYAAMKCEQSNTFADAAWAIRSTPHPFPPTAIQIASDICRAGEITGTGLDGAVSSAINYLICRDDWTDAVLEGFAEGVVQILIEMNAPGCQWLPLTQ